MSGGAAGNLRVADRCYRYLESNGEASVSELKDHLNGFNQGVTSQQLTNVLRCSPLFKRTGTTIVTYGAAGGISSKRSAVGGNNQSSAFEYTNVRTKITKLQGTQNEVGLYGIVPLKEVIEKLRGKQHLVRKRWPKVLKDAMKKEGII